MATNRMINEYDEIKGLLNKVRKIQAMTFANKQEQLLKEQISDDSMENPEEIPDEASDTLSEKEDVAVINNVEVEIHSEDPEDLMLQDDEKKKISQLIDDFRTEVSEIAEFDKLHVYNNSAKLDGKIPNVDITFTLSTGDDTGLYISNPSMLKIDDASLGAINKLKTFEVKFINSINDLLVNRSTT